MSLVPVVVSHVFLLGLSSSLQRARRCVVVVVPLVGPYPRIGAATRELAPQALQRIG